MSDKNDGGPVFPGREYAYSEKLLPDDIIKLGRTHGISLRDYFAAKAIQPVFDLHVENLLRGNKVCGKDNLAQQCYELADAMLAEREKINEIK